MAVVSLLPQPWKGRTALPGVLHGTSHILAFAVAFGIAAGRRAKWTALAFAAVALLIFGVTLEVLESAKFGNRLEYSDILFDASGIAAGAVSVLAARRRP
jgi:hypothetical protein